jgi:hypothetical protein
LFQTKHVVLRDVFPPQTLNDGFLALRSSDVSKWFIDQVYAKMRWGIPDSVYDQTAFYETVLELLEIEKRQYSAYFHAPSVVNFVAMNEWLGGSSAEIVHKPSRQPYRADCFKYVLQPSYVPGKLAFFTHCFHAWLRDLTGRAGARDSDFFGFVDPRVVDVNQVIGVVPEKALIYHHPGRGKWERVAQGLGDALNNTCAALATKYNSVDSCVPYNHAVTNSSSYCTEGFAIC